MATNDEIVRLVLETQGAKGLEEIRDKAEAARHGLESVAAASDKAEKSALNMGQAALQGGRAVQDFSQGGIGGILNNIEGLAAALGGGPGLAGIMTGVGLAAYFALPHLKSLWASIAEGANALPGQADALAQLNREFDEHKKRLEAIEKQGYLTNTQVNEYNALSAETLRLEKELNAQRRARQELDRLRDQKDPVERGIAEDVQAVMGGKDLDRFLGKAEAFLRAEDQAKGGPAFQAQEELRRRLREFADRNYQDPTDRWDEQARLRRGIAEQEDAVKVARAGIRTRVEDLAARAARGDEKALRELIQSLPWSAESEQLSQALPERRAEGDRDVQEAEDFGARAHDAGVRRREAARAANRADREQARKRKRVEDALDRRTDDEVRMSEQEDRLREQEAEEARRAAEKARRAAEKAARDNTPQARNRRAQEADEGRWLGAAQQAFPRYDADEQEKVARLAREQYQLGRRFGMTVEEAMMRGNNAFQAGMMSRLGTNTETFGQ